MDRALTVNGATSGLTYKFKVEARNVIGYSLPSVQFSIKAAIVPAAPLDVMTTRNVNSVRITWKSPSTNPVVDYGDAIIAYKVWIKSKDL
jgi:hypothetical protein